MPAQICAAHFKPEIRRYKLVWASTKLGNGVTSSFWLSPSWGMALQARFGFPQVGEWRYKLVLAFPRLGNGVTSSFWLFPSWGMVLQARFGFSQVGEWCYKLVLAFPGLGNGVTSSFGLSPGRGMVQGGATYTVIMCNKGCLIGSGQF
jgi:hypothetical protein